MTTKGGFLINLCRPFLDKFNLSIFVIPAIMIGILLIILFRKWKLVKQQKKQWLAVLLSILFVYTLIYLVKDQIDLWSK